MAASISVIMPAFNAAVFIREALESALGQTRPAAEIVVADDASHDATAEVVSEFGDRVRLLRNETNRGPSLTRNRGVEASAGEYIAFLDADDYWHEDHLENLARLLDEWPEAGAAFCQTHSPGGERWVWPPGLVIPDKPISLFVELSRPLIRPTALMMRREVFRQIRGFDDLTMWHEGRRIGLAEDYEFSLRLALATRFAVSPKPTAVYREHPGQAINMSGGVLHLRACFEYRLRMLEKLREDGRYQDLLAPATESTRQSWSNYLADAWHGRDLRTLRLLVRLGVREPVLSDITASYVWKSRVPAAAVSVWDRWRALYSRRRLHAGLPQF